MKNLFKLLFLAMILFSSCSTDDKIDCPAEVNKILEQFAPELEALLPPAPPDGLLIDPLFDWTPFYEKLAERDVAIEAIGCK